MALPQAANRRARHCSPPWGRGGAGRAAVTAILLLACGFLLAAQSDGQTVPAARQATTIGVISIHGLIDDMTLKTFERRLEQASRDGCQAVVLELDTPGGVVPSTLAMCYLLKSRGPANKVAWVRPQAFSAGVILALACREIVVDRESVLGDAAPIAIGAGGDLMPLPTEERAKLESPILSEVTDSALRSHHDVRLARAFVRTSDELWLLERDDGLRLFANAEECKLVLGGDPPRSTTRFVPDVRFRAPPPEPGADPLDNEIQQEDLVREPRVSSAEAGRWRLLGQVDSADELVTLRGSEAVSYGLASKTVASEEELKAFFGATTLLRYDESWSEGLVRFLISWPVRGVLIVVMLISLFAELASPGVGIFGAVSFVAFIVLVGAPALAGLAQWWEIVLIVGGIGLIVVELLITPGLGIAGAVGALCLLVGLVFSFVGGDLTSPTSHADLLTALLATLGSFAVAGVGIALLAKHVPSLPFFRRFVLDAKVSDGATLLALGPQLSGPAIGSAGHAMTDLRPTGRVQCDDRLVDARSSGAWIPRGRRVRVIDRDGLSVIVEEIA